MLGGSPTLLSFGSDELEEKSLATSDAAILPEPRREGAFSPFPSEIFFPTPPHLHSSGDARRVTSPDKTKASPSPTNSNNHCSETTAMHIEKSRLLAKVEVASQLAKPISAMCLDKPTITKNPNTVFWMRLIRSRWLLIQLRTGALELWDLSEDNLSTPIDSCHSIDGIIDDSVIEDVPCHNVIMLYFSTRSWVAYQLVFDLPYLGEARQANPKITPSICFRGCAGLSDVKGTLFVFSRTIGKENAGFIGDSSTAATVYLQPNTNIDINMSPLTAQYDLCRIKHEVLDIKVHEEVVIVARNCNFDIYSLDHINSLLRDRNTDTMQPFCHPIQSLVYPQLYESIYRASLICTPSSSLGVEQGAIVLLSVESSGCYGAVLHQRNDVHPTSSHIEFQIKPIDGIAEPDTLVFRLAMGLSGRRFATLSDRFLTLYPTCPPGYAQAQEGISEAFAAWLIPGGLGDIPGLLEFDETTGVCVVAMASGRIWVVDATGFTMEDSGLMPHNFAKGDSDATFIPNPDPARWPLTLPMPAPFGIEHSEKLPREIAPRWSDEVEKYFPFKNRPDCVASTPWFIHEAAHIPILQPGYALFKEDTYAKTLLFTVDELERSSIAFGYKEIVEVKPSPYSGEVHRLWLLQVFEHDWYFRKLKLTETLESVIDYLRRGERVESLLEDPRGECWPLDTTKVNGYLRWNFKYFSNFGRPGKKLL